MAPTKGRRCRSRVDAADRRRGCRARRASRGTRASSPSRRSLPRSPASSAAPGRARASSAPASRSDAARSRSTIARRFIIPERAQRRRVRAGAGCMRRRSIRTRRPSRSRWRSRARAAAGGRFLAIKLGYRWLRGRDGHRHGRRQARRRRRRMARLARHPDRGRARGAGGARRATWRGRSCAGGRCAPPARCRSGLFLAPAIWLCWLVQTTWLWWPMSHACARGAGKPVSAQFGTARSPRGCARAPAPIAAASWRATPSSAAASSWWRPHRAAGPSIRGSSAAHGRPRDRAICAP